MNLSLALKTKQQDDLCLVLAEFMPKTNSPPYFSTKPSGSKAERPGTGKTDQALDRRIVAIYPKELAEIRQFFQGAVFSSGYTKVLIKGSGQAT